MAVMDEFKEERQALKNGTPKEKISYFFYYYKWHVLIAVFAVILIVSFIVQLTRNKEDALYVCMLNTLTKSSDGYLSYSESDVYPDAFAEYAGIDTFEYDIRIDTTMSIDYDSLDENTITSAQKYMAYLAAGEMDVMITDVDTLENYSYQEDFYDLREILSPEQLQEYEPYFYYIDMAVVEERNKQLDDPNNLTGELDLEMPDPRDPDSMEEPVPVGIYLDDCENLRANYYYRSDDVVACVFVNTKRLDNALAFIDFVWENK